MAVTINTRSYYTSHLKSPRGNGMWAFGIGGTIVFFNGTFTEAKAQAVAAARTRKAPEVVVLP